MSYLIITGALACGMALGNAGPALLVRDGPRGHPAEGARAHPPQAQVAVHRALRHVPSCHDPAACFLVHQPRAARGVRLDGGAGRDLDPAGAGARGPVDVLLLPQAHPDEMHSSRRSPRRGSPSSRRSGCSTCSTTTRLPGQRRRPVHPGGVHDRPAVLQLDRDHRRAAASGSAGLRVHHQAHDTPAKYEVMGRFVNESV